VKPDTSARAASEDPSRLVAEVQAGSSEAFTQIVRLYQAKVRSYLGRFVRGNEAVDDLAQETFIAAYRGLSGFKEKSSLALWLLGIARNLALKHLREEQRRREHEADSFEAAYLRWSQDRMESEEASVDRHEQVVAALRSCIDRLQKNSADLIQEAYFRGRTAAEIAHDTGKTEGAVWVTMMRVRQALRACIGTQMARVEAR